MTVTLRPSHLQPPQVRRVQPRLPEATEARYPVDVHEGQLSPYNDRRESIAAVAPKSLLETTRRAYHSLLEGALGGVPLLGVGVNFALALSGWGQHDGRVGLGLLGAVTNGVGSLAWGASLVSLAGVSLAPVAAPLAVAAIGASALCAGATTWIANRY